MSLELHPPALGAAATVLRSEPAGAAALRSNPADDVPDSLRTASKPGPGHAVGPNAAMLRERAEAARNAGFDKQAVIRELVGSELDEALGVRPSATIVERIARVLQEDPVLSGLLARFVAAGRETH